MTSTRINICRLTNAVGALIEGVDLCRPLDAETVQTLRRALLDHGVIFFRDQPFDTEKMRAFASHFGTPMPEPFANSALKDKDPVTEGNLVATRYATAVWHSDTSYVPEPPMLTALRAVKLPPLGGDTCWASMYAAYDALSEPMRTMLDGLTAIHSMIPVLKRMPPALSDNYLVNEKLHGLEHAHPVIRVHPETGRKALFVSEAWTTRIVELTPAESDRMLSLLFDHVKSPDFSMRWHWAPNDVALWDNRSVQHYAVPDYETERVMQRVVIEGDRPYGPNEAATKAAGEPSKSSVLA